MLDSAQLKMSGLRFARSLQVVVRTAGMFSADHRSVEMPLQQSFDLLQALLREVGQFTVGFIDQQVVLNQLLTTDSSLGVLKKELLKRGIAAVTFFPGLTLSRFGKAVAVLAAPSKAIEEAGGTLPFLSNHQLDGIRILPASKEQRRTEQGDSIIDSDSEAYILAKQKATDAAFRDSLDSMDALLESACFDPSARASMLSGLTLESFDPAYGTPIAMPNLVIARDGSNDVGRASGPGLAGGGSVGGGTTGAATGSLQGAGGAAPAGGGAGPGTGLGFGPGTGPGFGPGTGPGFGPGTGPGFGPGTGPGFGPGAGSAGAGAGVASIGGPPAEGRTLGAGSSGIGNPASRGGRPGSGEGGGWQVSGANASGGSGFMSVVESCVERALVQDMGDPAKSYQALGRIFSTLRLETVLAHFAPERREAVSSLPPEELAAEYIEDTALSWAGKRLQSSDDSSGNISVQEDVVRVLGRSLRATQTADRLAQKLAGFFRDFTVPSDVQQRIKEELRWTAANDKDKLAQLMAITRYSASEFRRLIEYLKDLSKRLESGTTAALMIHYMDFLDQEGVEIRLEELSRVPELIRSATVLDEHFADLALQRLSRVAQRCDVPAFVHFQAVSALTSLAHALARFEYFDRILSISLGLEALQKEDPKKHETCCVAALGRLLPAVALERLVEVFLTQRGNPAGAKNTMTLLRLASPSSTEIVFNRLIKEEDSRNRFALLRLIAQIEHGAIAIAHRYLTDDRWYVVRNMCRILSDLNDPELAQYIVPALQHADVRVQQEALATLLKSKVPKRGEILAASLPTLAPEMLDRTLDELMFWRQAETVPHLEQFVRRGRGTSAVLRKAVQVLLHVAGDTNIEEIAGILFDRQVELSVRKLILDVLARRQSAAVSRLLRELADSDDPLASEARHLLPVV